MRGNTIKFDGFRRSTKHLKYGRTCVPLAKKWDILFEKLSNPEVDENKKSKEE